MKRKNPYAHEDQIQAKHKEGLESVPVHPHDRTVWMLMNPPREPRENSNPFAENEQQIREYVRRNGLRGRTCFVCSAVGFAAQCCFCQRYVCGSCLQQCEKCSDMFCKFCSTTNHEEQYDRTFCLICNESEAGSAPRRQQQQNGSSSSSSSSSSRGRNTNFFPTTTTTTTTTTTSSSSMDNVGT